MKNNIAIIVTGADKIPKCTPLLRRERYIEYSMALHKIFTYTYPVYGVLSEFDSNDTSDMVPFNKFNFRYVEYINLGKTDASNKSYSEIQSINELLKRIDIDMNDNTFIIKISGRYLILDDSFINTVISRIGLEVPAIVKVTNNNHIRTFLFALRYKYFKEFYANIKDKHTSVEYLLYDYLVKNNLLEKSVNLNKLGILANICNGNEFQVI
jgi:hypothetical protein